MSNLNQAVISNDQVQNVRYNEILSMYEFSVENVELIRRNGEAEICNVRVYASLYMNRWIENIHAHIQWDNGCVYQLDVYNRIQFDCIGALQVAIESNNYESYSPVVNQIPEDYILNDDNVYFESQNQVEYINEDGDQLVLVVNSSEYVLESNLAHDELYNVYQLDSEQVEEVNAYLDNNAPELYDNQPNDYEHYESDGM